MELELIAEIASGKVADTFLKEDGTLAVYCKNKQAVERVWVDPKEKTASAPQKIRFCRNIKQVTETLFVIDEEGQVALTT